MENNLEDFFDKRAIELFRIFEDSYSLVNFYSSPERIALNLEGRQYFLNSVIRIIPNLSLHPTLYSSQENLRDFLKKNPRNYDLETTIGKLSSDGINPKRTELKFRDGEILLCTSQYELNKEKDLKIRAEFYGISHDTDTSFLKKHLE